jgi:hypothetical protein
MNPMEFYQKVDAHKGLTWLGCSPEAGEVFVEATRLGSKLAVPLHEILDHEWDELEAVLIGKRRSRVLTHITRIVGYYSATHNWNRSKIAELNDRHKKSEMYKLPEKGEPTLENQPELPAEVAGCLAAAAQDRMVCQVGGRKN